MLEEIILCDLERTLDERNRKKQKKVFPVKQLQIDDNILTGTSEPDEYIQKIDTIIKDVKEKMSAIRHPELYDAYPTVLEGSKLKVLVKRSVRKLTWWFFNKYNVAQHWRNEMAYASIEFLCDSIKILEERIEKQQKEYQISLSNIQEQQGLYIAALEEQLNEQLTTLEEQYDEQIIALEECQEEQVASLEERQNEQIAALEERQNEQVTSLEERQNEQIAALEERQNEQVTSLKELQKTRLSALEKQIDKTTDDFITLKTDYSNYRTSLSIAEEKAKMTAYENDIGNYIDYVAFENKYRGSQQEIKDRIKRYLQYFMPNQTVTDLGCGRGEWLELLKEFGVNAIGVDINPKNVEMCRVRQLNAIQNDMFDYLEKTEDASLDGITSLQVIEHITPAQLAKLIVLCRKKLRTGGVLILETPNPAVLYTMAINFYVDPTHNRPVHPQWLKYLLETNGFEDAVIDFPDYSIIWDKAQTHYKAIENQADADRRLEALNNLLFGPTDYAIIAHKTN